MDGNGYVRVQKGRKQLMRNLLRFKMGSFTWWLHQGTVEIPIYPPVLHNFCARNGSRLEERRRT